MCDEFTVKDNEEYLGSEKHPGSEEHLSKAGISRRNFGKIGAGATLAMMLPPVANAQDVVEQEVMVPTPDGEADCYFVHPAEGAHAAVIVWPDVMSIRPSFRLMGKRLAESGYAVLVVNPYYRTVNGRITPEGGSFGDPAIREILLPHARSLSPQTCVTDGRAFVAYLDQQASVDSSKKIGTTGYCMTGSYTIRLAADMPDRIGAGGSFHGGGLVTEAADSPHLLAPRIKAGMLIAIAENDDEKDPDAKNILRESFDAAGVEAEIEVYEGAMHGWCPPDSPVYNEQQAERAWSRLLALFEKELA